MQLVFLNVILFLFQFEFIGYEEFSVYRCLIFPLLLFSVIKYGIRISTNDLKWIVIVGVFFLIRLISSFYYSDYWSLIDVAGQALLFIYTYNYVKNNRLSKSTLCLLATWSVVHLVFFIAGWDSPFRATSGQSLIVERFFGFHWDPNYLCGCLLVAMWAKVYLYKLTRKIYLRITFIAFIVLDVVMTLATLSKGGFLTLSITVLFYHFVYNKKFFAITLSLIVLFCIYAGSVYTQLGYGESSFINRQIYRFFTKSVEKGDYTTGRSAFYQNYVDMMKLAGEGVFMGIPQSRFNQEYNGDMYCHSLIIGLWIFSGFLAGTLFFCIILYCIILESLYSIVFKGIPFYFIFALTLFCVLFNLSVGGSKIIWFVFGLFFALSNKLIFKNQLDNVKTVNNNTHLQR